MKNICDIIDEYVNNLKVNKHYIDGYNVYLKQILKISYDLAIERNLDPDLVVLLAFYLKAIQLKKIKNVNFVNLLFKGFDLFAGDKKAIVKIIAQKKGEKRLESPEFSCVSDARAIFSIEEFKKEYINKANDARYMNDLRKGLSIINNLYQFSSEGIKEKYKDDIIVLNKRVEGYFSKEEHEQINFYKVVAKCGHVGKNKYYPGVFVVKALNAKEAAEKARAIPRVKHGNKYAILSVEKINAKMAEKLYASKDKEIYFHIENSENRKRCAYLINRKVIEEKPRVYKNQEKQYSNKKDEKGKKIRKYKKFIKFNDDEETENYEI